MDVKEADPKNEHLMADKLDLLQRQARESHSLVEKHIRTLVSNLRHQAEQTASSLAELNNKYLCDFLEDCREYELIGVAFQTQSDRVLQYELEITQKLNSLAALLPVYRFRTADDISQDKQQSGTGTKRNIAVGVEEWDADSYASPPVRQLGKDAHTSCGEPKRPRLQESFDVEVEEVEVEVEVEDASSGEDWQEEGEK